MSKCLVIYASWSRISIDRYVEGIPVIHLFSLPSNSLNDRLSRVNH